MVDWVKVLILKYKLYEKILILSKYSSIKNLNFKHRAYALLYQYRKWQSKGTMTPIDPSIRILDEHRNNFSLLRETQRSPAHLSTEW